MPFHPPTHLSEWAEHLEQTAWRRGPVAVYAQTASTQDVCRGRAAGFVCVAGNQSAGRGRLGRTWEAPPDAGLTLSLVVPRDLSHGRLSLAVPVAVCRALAPWLSAAGLSPAIKWPNDIYAKGRKLAGILIEVENGLPIVGIGVNALALDADFPAELRDKATSLAALGALAPNADRLPLLAALLREMDRVLDELELRPQAVIMEWKNRCMGFPAAFRCDGRLYAGTVLDVDAERGLVLRLDSGEITHLPAAGTTTEI